MSSSPDELAVRALQRPRPPPAQLLDEWQRYFADPLLSLAALKADAEQGVLHDKRGLRSLSWRYFLGLLPAPTPSPTTPASREPYELGLAQSRTAYTALRERYLRSPDGRWVADGPGDSPAAAGKGQARVEDLKVNNPLGLDDGNPWQEWFSDLETRSEIRKDVLRTFPEIDYFRSAETQDRMTDLLFIWCKLAPEVGYRQGMHELLAPLLWFVDYDSLPPAGARGVQGGDDDGDGDATLAHLVLAREWVEHDTWALFAAVMQSAKVFYDHTPSVTLTPRSSSAFHAPGQGPSPSSSALVQPVVALSSHLHSLLLTVDPSLARTFTVLQVEPQLYAIRWFRLLFSREFPLPATLTLWDALLATDGTSLRLATHIALALLLRARDALIRAASDGDYGAFVQLLLRYPPCADGGYATALLVRQGLHLRDNCSPEGARHVRRENAALGTAIGEPLSDDELGGDALEASTPYGGGARAAGAPTHRRVQTVAQVNGLGFFGGEGGLVFGDLAKGVLAKSEALGINKALRGTYDEIKRGVAEAQSLAEERRRAARRSPSASGFSQTPQRAPWGVPSPSPTSPIAGPADPTRSPPPPPAAAKDALADLEAMRRTSSGMSAAIARAVGVLERAVGPDKAQEDEVKAALDALRHVGDVLGGRADGFLGPASQGSQASVSTATATSSSARAQPANGGTTLERPSPLASAATSTSASPNVDAALPSKYLGARTDKPLPSLSRTPQTPSPALPPPPPPPPSSQGSPAYPPAPASSAASYPPSPMPAPPRSPAVASYPSALPPPTSTLPSPAFSTRPAASRPPAAAPLDPLGALSSL